MIAIWTFIPAQGERALCNVEEQLLRLDCLFQYETKRSTLETFQEPACLMKR
jgi:hypothetical protein